MDKDITGLRIHDLKEAQRYLGQWGQYHHVKNIELVIQYLEYMQGRSNQKDYHDQTEQLLKYHHNLSLQIKGLGRLSDKDVARFHKIEGILDKRFNL